MAVVTAGARAGQRLQNRQPPGAQFTPHSNPARCLFFARLPPKPVANPDLSPDLSPDPSPNLSPDLGRSRGSPQPLGCASSGAPIFSLRKRCELPPRKNRAGYKLLRVCDFDSRCTTQQFLPPIHFWRFDQFRSHRTHLCTQLDHRQHLASPDHRQDRRPNARPAGPGCQRVGRQLQQPVADRGCRARNRARLIRPEPAAPQLKRERDTPHELCL